MADFNFRLPAGALTSALNEAADDYVKHVFEPRRVECLEAIGELLDEEGYLPDDTTWEVFGDRLQFSTYKDSSNEDLAHYFFEGQIYGPNRPKWDEYEMTIGKNGKPKYVRDEKGRKIGKGEPSEYKTPAGTIKYPKKGQMLKQGVGSPMGVRHWTDAVQEGGALWDEVIDRCEEILRR